MVLVVVKTFESRSHCIGGWNVMKRWALLSSSELRMKISSLSLLAPNNPLDDTSFGLITQRIATNSKEADFLFCSCQKEDKHTLETSLALCTISGCYLIWSKNIWRRKVMMEERKENVGVATCTRRTSECVNTVFCGKTQLSRFGAAVKIAGTRRYNIEVLRLANPSIPLDHAAVERSKWSVPPKICYNWVRVGEI